MWHSPTTDTRGRRLVEFLSANSLTLANEKDGPTFSSPQGESWIDITVTSKNMAHKIHNWLVSDEETQSDHNLITFELLNHTSNTTLIRKDSNSTKKFATQVGHWKLFQNKINQRGNQWLLKINNATSKKQLDETITSIWQQLNEINKLCFPPFLPTNKFNPWWSTKLSLLRKHVNAAKRRAKRCKNPKLKEIYKSKFKVLKNQYKQELMQAKRESWERFCTEHSRKSPWKIYKHCKTEFVKGPPPSTLTLIDGTPTMSEIDTAKALLDRFLPDDVPEQDSDDQHSIRESLRDCGAPDTPQEPEFETHEVEEVIAKLNEKKCPGLDGIDGAIIKNIQKNLPKFWMTVFNKCLSLGCFPKVWKEARVIAIPKSDRRKLLSVTGYRGISLLSIPGKCLEKLVMERLDFSLHEKTLIPPQQYGFIAGKSSTDAIKAVSDIVHQGRSKGLKSCLLALDICGAFDNAWHPSIKKRLRELNCPSNIYNIIVDFLQDRTAYFRQGNSSTSKNVTKGCPQGSVSGPTLWNIIVSGLISKLVEVPDLETVVYADDIMIILSGTSHDHILTTLQVTLQIMQDWCTKNKLEIARDKSSLMPMYARKKDTYARHPLVTEWGLKVVTRMKYLGVMLDHKMDWYPHSLYLENKALRIRNGLVRCSKATWGMSFHHLMTIYHQAILPVIMYAADTWSPQISKRAKKKLNQIQRHFLLFATKAYKTVSYNALQAIACAMPLDPAVLLHNDLKAISKGQPTNAVIPLLKRTEKPTTTKRIHPKDNPIKIDFTGTVGNADYLIFTDGSKTENHVGAGMVAERNSKEIFINIKRLDLECSVFQAELLGILMAAEWIELQKDETSTYAIHVDSQAALLVTADRRTTHPLAVQIREKIITLKKTTKIDLHWVKGHAGLRGNDRADYLAKIAASHKTTTDYNLIPLTRGKQLLKEYYEIIWNSIYTKSKDAYHTKIFIPNIPHRLSLSLWPNYVTTQFLTNHGRFKSYLHKMNKTASPLCNCPEKPPQTALHLMTECTMFSRNRPAVLQTASPPNILKVHINTVNVAEFLMSVFHQLQQ